MTFNSTLPDVVAAQPTVIEAVKAARAAGRTGNILSLARQGRALLASQATAAAAPASARTLSRAEFEQLPHAERNQFIRAGGKLTESPREKNAFAAFQQSRTNA